MKGTKENAEKISKYLRENYPDNSAIPKGLLRAKFDLPWCNSIEVWAHLSMMGFDVKRFLIIVTNSEVKAKPKL